jgi:hypothetical protein
MCRIKRYGFATFRDHCRSAKQLDGTLWPDRVRQPPVRGKQGAAQRFRQGDVGSVVDSQVLAEVPAPVQQGYVRRSTQREIREITEGESGAASLDPSFGRLAADNRGHLEVDEMWRRQ